MPSRCGRRRRSSARTRTRGDTVSFPLRRHCSSERAMGSLVSLGVGRLEIDWGKNEFFRNHSALFLPHDVRDAPYYYADDVVEQKPAFVRGLPSVAKRLEMLGYTLDGCRERYESAIAAHPSYYPPPPLSYDQFAAALGRIDVHRVRTPEEGDYDLGELAVAIMR